MTKTVVNVLIVLAIAALVAVVPGGGTAASVIGQAVFLAFLAATGWFAAVMYRQHRLTLYGLGDRRRATVYAAVGVGAITLTCTHRMWGSSAGSVAWLALLGAAVYALAAVVISARRA